MAEEQSEGIAPGAVLGHFTLDEEIGGGAMGRVFKGSDRRDGSHVAVKILNPQFSRDPTFRQRFEREAHVATLLKSPYTVQTLAFGREQGAYYLVMEFVEGQPVDKLIESGPMPLDDALEIATDTARALEAAAAAKLVHRDVKPSNIIVSPDGAAKLVDFGIAGQANVQDAGGNFIGTVQYAPPEQQRGVIDERTDIYALGATLFHMLAGRPPYVGRTNDEILQQHLHAPFPGPLLALQPEPVVDVVRRCMQKDPEDRYHSAADLAAALDRVRMRIAQVRAQTAPVVSDEMRTLVPEPEPEDATGDTLVLPGRGGPGAAGVAAAGLGGAALGAAAASASGLTGETVIHAAPPGASIPGPGAPPAPPLPASSQPPPVASQAPLAAAAAAQPVAPAAPPETLVVPPPDKPRGRRGMMLAFLGGGAAIAAIAAVVAVFALGGGDGGDPAAADGSPTASPSASARASASASASAGASASADASGTPSETATASETATPTAPPTDTPTPTVPPATPTPTSPPQPTATPAPPTPTPPPPQASFSASVSGGCGGISTFVSFSNAAPGTTITASYSGGSTGLLPNSQSVSGSGSVSFGTPPVGPGSYNVSVTANGAFVGGGGVSC